MKNRMGAALAYLFLLGACDTSGGTDAGVPPLDTGMPEADAGPALDAGPEDAGPPLCGGEVCAADEACVRDVCLATCGADLSGWDAALAAGLTPVYTFCRDASAFGVVVDATGARVLDVQAVPTAAGTDLVLSEWRADPAMGQPAPTEIQTASVEHATDTLLFPGGYVVGGDDGVLFGYTLSDATFSGAVLWVDLTPTVTVFDATGNFDAADGGDGVFYVNGLGLEGAGASGQALYALAVAGPTAAQVVTGLGSSSGGVALTDDYALVGGLDDLFVGHVYGVPRAALDAAAGGGAAIADPTEVLTSTGSPLGSAFSLVHGAIVLPRYDDTFALEALEAHLVQSWTDADGATLAPAMDLTTGPTFSGAHAASGAQMLLRFDEGLLLVE